MHPTQLAFALAAGMAAALAPTLQAQPQELARWSRVADLNTSHAYHACVVVAGKLYVVGGGRNAAFEEFDARSNTWRVLPPMRTARVFCSAAAVGRKIFAVGGLGATNDTLSSVECFDLDRQIWTNVADLPAPCNRLAAVSLNGKLYAIGGMDRNGNTRSLYEYDPATDRWTNRAQMPTARHGHCAVVANGKILVLGGYTADVVGTVEEWNPGTDRWTKKAELPTARGFFGAAELNGFVFAIAGRGGGEPPVERYDAQANTWRRLEPMPVRFLNRFGTAVLDGRIYLVGGERQEDPDTPRRVWRYEPDCRR